MSIVLFRFYKCNITDCMHGSNPIMVNNFVFLFGCMPVGQASDSMMAPAKRLLSKLVVA